MREHLRARLQRAADKRGATLTQEIADRLEKSFETESMQKLSEITEHLAQQAEGIKDIQSSVGASGEINKRCARLPSIA
jgi:ribosomal protein L18E